MYGADWGCLELCHKKRVVYDHLPNKKFDFGDTFIFQILRQTQICTETTYLEKKN